MLPMGCGRCWRPPERDVGMSADGVRDVVGTADAVSEVSRRIGRLDVFDLVPLVHDRPVSDPPLAVAAFEAVDVPAAERHERRAALVGAAVAGAHVTLDVGDIGRTELDPWIADRVHRGLVPLGQPADHVLGEVDSRGP